MTASELALIVAVVLCAIGFAALVVVLVRVHDTLNAVRREVSDLRAETAPLLAELRETTDAARETMITARDDLERFDRVLGSAEAVSDAVEGSSRAARRVFSAPVIKAAGLAAGVRRAGQRIRRGDERVRLVEVTGVSEAIVGEFEIAERGEDRRA